MVEDYREIGEDFKKLVKEDKRNEEEIKQLWLGRIAEILKEGETFDKSCIRGKRTGDITYIQNLLFPRGLKICSHCDKVLNITEYNKETRNVDELCNTCRECSKQKQKKTKKKRNAKAQYSVNKWARNICPTLNSGDTVEELLINSPKNTYSTFCKYLLPRGLKICKKCYKVSYLSNFDKRIESADGFDCVCKDCIEKIRIKSISNLSGIEIDSIPEGTVLNICYGENYVKYLNNRLKGRGLRVCIKCSTCKSLESYDKTKNGYSRICKHCLGTDSISDIAKTVKEGENILKFIQGLPLKKRRRFVATTLTRGLKVCIKCGICKKTDKFDKDRYQPDGLRSVCKECRSTQKKEHKQQPEKAMEERDTNYLDLASERAKKLGKLDEAARFREQANKAKNMNKRAGIDNTNNTEDSVTMFLNLYTIERVKKAPIKDQCTARVIYEVYRTWCEIEHRDDCLRKSDFKNRLCKIDKGRITHTNGGNDYYKYLILTEEAIEKFKDVCEEYAPKSTKKSSTKVDSLEKVQNKTISINTAADVDRLSYICIKCRRSINPNLPCCPFCDGD